MDITIKYKIINDENLYFFNLTPESYFDPIAEDETYENDGIPVFNSAIRYIQEIDHIEKIEFTEIIISGSSGIDRTIKTTYLGNGQSEVITRKDQNGFESIIHCIKIAQNCIYIGRMERDNPDSEWKCMGSSIGLNYEKEPKEEEVWFSVRDGEFINQYIKLESENE